MEIGIERGHREGLAVYKEATIRAAHLVDPQPREVLLSLPGWWALVSEKKQVFLERKPLRYLMLLAHSGLVRMLQYRW